MEKFGNRVRNSLQSRSWEENGSSGGELRGIRYRCAAIKTEDRKGVVPVPYS